MTYEATRPGSTAHHALVSVIVTVYNVEKYVARCLDSIISQTYTNLEILVIDDGSTDSSGKICDEYAELDQRIRVIHQENKGIAEVRNVGLREAKGEYIQSVDGDDWIAPETIQTCYNLSKQYDADIVSFLLWGILEDGRRFPLSHFAPRLVSSDEALSLIPHSKYISASPCNKFAKREVFRGVKYPAGKLFEDLHTVHKYVGNARNVLLTDNPFYNHFQRSGSITHTIFSSRTYDLAEAIDDCYNFVMKRCGHDPQMKNNILVGICCRKLDFVNHMIKAGKGSYDKKYIQQLRKDISLLRVLKYPHIKLKKKIQLLLFKYSLSLYSLVYLRFRADKTNPQ